MKIHPSFKKLNRFADGELNTQSRDRVATHLADCATCRGVIQSIREISREAPHIMQEDPPPGVLDRVLERRGKGERIILPTTQAARSRHPFVRLVGVAAAVLVMVLTGVVVVGPGVLRADRSELILTPETPERGAIISVEYSASALLANEDRLMLRARFRRPNDPSFNIALRHLGVVELIHDGGGRYRGQFALPDSVVYGAFAVEDLTGQKVDTNNDRLWDLLVHQNSIPEYAALMQKFHDHMGRSSAVVVSTIREAASYYPDNPGALEALNFATTLIDRQDEHDSLRLVVENGFRDMHDLLSTITLLDADVLSTMFLLSRRIATGSVADYWKERFLEEAPQHPRAIQERSLEILQTHRSNHTAMMQEYEQLWSEVGPAHHSLASYAWQEALDADDEEAMALWASRREALEPWTAESHARVFVEYESLRERGEEKLRSIAAALEPTREERRRLRFSMDGQISRDEIERRRLFSYLGKSLIASGDIEAGLDTLEIATATGWDPIAFRTSAEAHLSLADTTKAMALYARVAIDPATDSETYDFINDLADSVSGGNAWQEQLADAQTAMRAWLLNEGINRTLNQQLRVMDGENETADLWDIIRNRTALVIMWHWTCDECVWDLQGIGDALANIERTEVALLALVSDDSLSVVQQIFEERGLSIPVFMDRWDDVKLAFRTQGQPLYAVVDRHGRLRYAGYYSWEALRATQVLSHEETPIMALGDITP